MQLSPSGMCFAGRGCGVAPPLLRGSSRASLAPGAARAVRARSVSRTPRRVVATVGAGSDEQPAATDSCATGLSMEDASSLLSSVESDLKRFRAFEAQNEAGISRLAGITVQPASVADNKSALGLGRSRADAAALSPAQMARVWKARGTPRTQAASAPALLALNRPPHGCAPQEKQSALDELERQADLIEAELAERERKLQVRPASGRSGCERV